MGEKAGRSNGSVRASAHIRVSARFDNLIISHIFVKTTRRPGTVVMEIHASLCVIVEITSQDGCWRKRGREREGEKEKPGSQKTAWNCRGCRTEKRR